MRTEISKLWIAVPFSTLQTIAAFLPYSCLPSVTIVLELEKAGLSFGSDTSSGITAELTGLLGTFGVEVERPAEVARVAEDAGKRVQGPIPAQQSEGRRVTIVDNAEWVGDVNNDGLDDICWADSTDGKTTYVGQMELLWK